MSRPHVVLKATFNGEPVSGVGHYCLGEHDTLRVTIPGVGMVVVEVAGFGTDYGQSPSWVTATVERHVKDSQ